MQMIELCNEHEYVTYKQKFSLELFLTDEKKRKLW